MNPGDTTDVLPAVPGQMPASPPAACPLARHSLAGAWCRVNIYGFLALGTWALLTGGAFLLLVDLALWNAR